MPNCPSCGAEINELHLIVVETTPFIAFINNGELDYKNRDVGNDERQEDDETYNCPCCNAVVANSIEEARRLLLNSKRR